MLIDKIKKLNWKTIVEYIFKNAPKINIMQFMRLNFFTKQIHRDRGCFIIPYRRTYVSIHKTANVYLHGIWQLNANLIGKSKEECLIEIREGAILTIQDSVFLYYGTNLQVHKDAQLTIGEARFNTGSTIICAYKMFIGFGVSTARGVYIFDSDHHPVFNNEGKRINDAKEVIIEDNVWIGLKSTIMKGAHINTGTVISAHSLVSGEIPGGCIVATVPARPVMKDISWHR